MSSAGTACDEAGSALIDCLDRRPVQDGAAVVGWRVETATGQGFRVGIRDSRLGGPYEGPAAADRVAGSVEVRWSDGRVTRANLDRRAVEAPASSLGAWRDAAVPERGDAVAPLATAVALPSVATCDPEVQRALAADPGWVLRLLVQARAAALAAGAQRIDAALRVSAGRRQVATSAGFRAAWDETACAFDLWADEVGGAHWARRALPTAAEIDRLADEAAGLARRLRTPAALPPAARGALLMPAAVDDLVARLLLPNLAGRAIRDGRSPFTPGDVAEGRQVMRPDLDLIVDTTLPLELASAPCSPDGVPGGRVALVAGGRLRSPLLDPATAPSFGLPPTPVARGNPLALLHGSAPSLSVEAALVELGAGVVVRDVPGLHTQAVRRGAYALVVPDAQAVVGGAAAGRCAVRMRGNLLDHLRRPTTRLVAVPGALGPGLLVVDGLELAPA